MEVKQSNVFGEMEKEIASLKSRTGAQGQDRSPDSRQRLFGSSSEKLDPAQLQLLFDEIVLGEASLPEQSGRNIRTGGGKTKRAKEPPHQS